MENGVSPVGDAIVADGLVKRYANGTEAVRDVSFSVGTGEIVGIVGPNGAGKSTTLNMLATLISPTAGDARVFGVPVRNRAAVRPLLGVALQATGLDPLMTVEDHFEVHAALHGIRSSETRTRSRELVDAFQLGAVSRSRTGELSGGTQRRLSLALALLHRPRAIIFDEPSVGLDPHVRRGVWDLLEDLRARGLAILFSTHYMDEAERLCQRIELMSKGEIVASGSPSELKTMLDRGVLRIRVLGGAERARDALSSDAARELLPAGTRPSVTHDRIQIHADLADVGFLPALTELLRRAGVDLVDVHWGYGSLDDVFTQLAESVDAEDPAPAVTVEHRAHARRRRGR